MIKYFLSIVLIVISTLVFGQTGTIKGFVVDKSNGEAITNASVQLLGKGKGTQTDINGFFNLPKVVAGTYKVAVTYSGYDSVQLNVVIESGEIVNKKIAISKRSNQIQDIVVSRKKQDRVTETKVGTIKITTKDIKALPSIGGEPDIAQFLQVMPGVTFTGDQGGQLYIRGGSPVQNKILLDGMTLYNPFHSIGLFSVFETEAIRSAEVMSGGFGVEYGDRTSAIVSVNTKDGNKNKTSGKLSVSPILAKVFLEGPLLKSKNADGGSVSYLLSAKHSYLNNTSKAYSFLGKPYSDGLPFSFTDLYGKISINSGIGGKFNIFGFNFKDGVKYATTDLAWTNNGIGTNFVISPGSSSSLITGGFNYSSYKINLAETDGRPRSSKINGFDGSIAVTSFLENNCEFKYGFEVTGFNTLYEFYNRLGIKSDQDENTTQLGGFAKYKYNYQNKLIIEPGFRFQYYSSLGQSSPEPRIAMKYNFNKNLRIKAAVGRYSQNLISNKSDKDIVNLFTGFLTGPDAELEKMTTDANGVKKLDNNNIQYANHFIGGIEFEKGDFEITLEPWLKDFRQLIAFNRYKIKPSDPDFLIEKGMAQGIDFTTKYTHKKLYIWSVFSLGKITRTDKTQTYPPPFDRRYNVNLVATYTTGKKLDWEFAARFNYGSAFPFTLTQSLYENVDLSQTGLNTNYLTQNGSLNILYDQTINGGRLSDYHRLDVSIKKKIDMTSKTTADITLGITNAYDRRNIFYVNRITNARQYQLPLFPTVAISWNF